MNQVFLDSNVLIYSLSAGDPRQTIARALLQTGGVISTQVLNEVASVASRKLRLSWTEVDQVLALMLTLCPACVALTPGLTKEAVRLAGRYGFAFYDGLIVAAALAADCTVLLSEDMHDGLLVEQRLTVRNLFS